MARSDTLKLIFAPWGAEDYGDDLWLLENALVFCLESVIDILPPVGSASYADLYSQLQGDKVRSAPVAAYTQPQIRQLADRAPRDVDGIIDGILSDIRRDPDTDALVSVQIAARVLIKPTGKIELPDSLIFDGFAPHHQSRSELHVADETAFFAFAAALAEIVLAPLGVELPTYIDGERLAVTQSWDAFIAFIKGKRLARTVEEKRGYYRQALRADPHFYWALFNEAQILKGQRDFTAARRLFMDALKGAHGDPALLGETYFEIGLCSVSLGDPKTARNFWDQALIYAPDNPTIITNIAGTYEQEADFNKAINLHHRVLSIDPNAHKSLVSLGRLEAMAGDLDAAIDYYKRALALQPEDALRHAILGGCYVAKNDPASAREHLNIASRLDPPRAQLAPVTGSDALDDTPAPGDYARQELAKLDEFEKAKTKKRWW